MKKVFTKSLFGLIGLLSISFVSAETNFEVWGRSTLGGLGKIATSLKFTPGNSTTILLGILLWMVIHTIIKKTGIAGGTQAKVWPVIISLIITILAFIYIPETLLMSIGANYGALGATILTVLPFFFAFYFTTAITEDYAMAKIIWFMFMAYYLLMFAFTWGFVEPSTSTINYFGNEVKSSTLDGFFYIIGSIASLTMFIFLGFFRNTAWKAQLEGRTERAEHAGEEAVAGVKLFKNIFRSTAED